ERERDDRREQIRLDEADAIRDTVTDRVLAGHVEGLRRDVGAKDLDLAESPPAAQRRRQGDRDGAAAGAYVGDPQRGGSRRPWRGRQPAHDLSLGELHDQLGFGARNQCPRIDREGETVELLEATYVGDRLAVRPPFAVGLIDASWAVADDDLRVGEQAGLVDADGFREEQLGVQTRTLRPAGAQ